jgi:mRNA interferase YafQ
MRRPVYSGQFKRDVRRAERRGADMAKFKALAILLLSGGPLPAAYRDHPLKGRWASFREAHIEPDWLLIYKIVEDDVRFERMGTHSDLFDK